MKDINALLWQQMEDQFCETEQSKKIFDGFSMRYLQPNAAAFRDNYEKVCHMLNAIEYDECALDFIPIADKEYVILDKRKKRFCGTFVSKPYEEDSSVEKSIFSVLIADEWDIRKMMPFILEKRWNYVYFVLNKETKKFASFFKLKEFLTTLPPNIKFFATTEEMRQYFMDDHNAYLPRKIIAAEPKIYEELFNEIHYARLRNGIHSNNVFLSICIPTYNRGELALNAVKTALSAEFDAEIEIIVSDNGSTIGKKAYEEISNIQDSRLYYYRAEENLGVVCNILTCLKKATGHFAILFSDEDSLVVENIEEVLNWLICRESYMGGCIFCGSEENPYYVFSEEKVFKAGVEAVIRACHSNYITGTCFNLDQVKALDLLVQIEKYKENSFYIDYPHSAMMALLALRFNVIESPVVMWKLGDESAQSDSIDVNNGLYYYALPEGRMREEQDSVSMMAEFLSEDDLIKFFINRVNTFFSLISLYYTLQGDKLKELYCWNDIWTANYQCCLQILRDLKGKFENITSVIPKMNRSFLYWHICKREQRCHTPEENLLPSLQAQVAKYYYDKGIDIEDIDFDQIEKDLEGWVQDFLEKRR